MRVLKGNKWVLCGCFVAELRSRNYRVYKCRGKCWELGYFYFFREEEV